VNINSGTLVNNSWIENHVGKLNNNGGIIVNNGVIFNDYGGLLNSNAGGIIENNSNIVSIFGGSLNNNSGSILNNTGSINNSDGGILNNEGTVNNNVGGIIINNSGLSAVDLGGQLRNNAGGTLNNQGTLVNAFYAMSNAGTLNNSGLINGDGTYQQTGGQTLNTGSMTQALINIQSGSFLNDGIVTVSGKVENSGILTGKGTINGNVANYGTVNPGSSIGTMNVIGNYIQGSQGALNIDIAGSTQDVLFDKLHITGTASLSGSLSIDNSHFGGILTVGDTFTFITADLGLSGTFSSYKISTEPSYWKLLYSTKDVSLEYLGAGNTSPVPVPGTALLLSSALAGLAGLRRKNVEP
jgi:hypothetical protein